MTILEDVKAIRGIQLTNAGFDSELLFHINSVRAELVQMGLVEFEGIEIDDETLWPMFANDTVKSFVVQYVGIKVGIYFDPIPSETIQRTFERSLQIIEGRLLHELEEIAAAP